MSSTILTVIVLVVMWLVVLVPMFVRRADESAGLGGLDERPVGDHDTGESGDVSARRPARRALTGRLGDAGSEFDLDDDQDDFDLDLDDRDEVDLDQDDFGRDDVDRDAGPAVVRGSATRFARTEEDLHWEVSGEVDAQGFEGSASGTARARMIARRRRMLTILTALTLGTLALVLVTRGRSGAWVVQLGCDLLLAGYLVGLRRGARRERARQFTRTVRQEQRPTQAHHRGHVDQPAPVDRPARTGQASQRPPARPAASGTGGTPSRSVRDHLSLAEPDDPIERRRVV